jgi:single-stranded-DNA-specific exonuclease
LPVIRGRHWRAAPYSYAEALALSTELGLSMTTASVLSRRGLTDPAAARRFIEASESHDAFEFSGMRQVTDLMLEHVRRGSRIAVHGDYDVDGVCSTALLVSALRDLGATVTPRLPSRMEDGYGLSDRTVQQLHAQGAALLITVDCGIGAVDEAALARSLGMDVIVTDHHRPPDVLPDCPIVHPALCGYPCADLCATGVAYKLAQALFAAAGRSPDELETELDLVCLATIADVVPLVGENRMLAKQGLRSLAGTGRPGLRALMKVAGVDPQSVREHTVAFALAPRINAAGRLYRADAALELLLTDDDGRALEIARELDAINIERQSVETRILFEAEQALSALPDHRDDPVYVLAGEGWHAGVIGIVASRLVERYGRPCVLIALDGDRGRGSARSIGAYDLHGGLESCAELLERFGGHRMAAGLEISAANLDRFRAALVDHARSMLRDEDLIPIEHVDAVVSGDVVGLALAEELESLRPFGMGNPGVNLLVPAARTSDVRSMGEGRHARFTVHSAGVRTPVVAFGVRESGLDCDGGETRQDLVGRLEANEWQGAIAPRLVLRSLHPVEPAGDCPSAGGVGCAGCECQARGTDWWARVWRELERDLDRSTQITGAARRVVDRRGSGIIGGLSDLLSSGESLAVVCTDCSRRRSLFEQELDGGRFGRAPATVLSSRCTDAALTARFGSLAEDAFVLTDHSTVEADPSSVEHFTHVFLLEPPPSSTLMEVLCNSAARPAAGDDGQHGESFLHLGWGAAEVDLATGALEQDYGLRGPLTSIYRALAAAPEGLADEALEQALRGDGRHPRTPALAGRCLRVLAELELLDIESSGATVRCTISPARSDRYSDNGRVDLERSSVFRSYSALHREALRYLSEQAQPARTERAA